MAHYVMEDPREAARLEQKLDPEAGLSRTCFRTFARTHRS
jgi:hypothetical protein